MQATVAPPPPLPYLCPHLPCCCRALLRLRRHHCRRRRRRHRRPCLLRLRRPRHNRLRRPRHHRLRRRPRLDHHGRRCHSHRHSRRPGRKWPERAPMPPPRPPLPKQRYREHRRPRAQRRRRRRRHRSTWTTPGRRAGATASVRRGGARDGAGFATSCGRGASSNPRSSRAVVHRAIGGDAGGRATEQLQQAEEARRSMTEQLDAAAAEAALETALQNRQVE